MKFIDISFEDYSNLRNELNEFVMLAKSRDYTPSKDEFDDIIKFILLYQNGGATLCESYNNQDLTSQKLTNQLYESFHLKEDEKDFDSAVGTATTAVKGAAAGAAGAAVGAGILISYLFKKGKVKKSINAEFESEFSRLKNFEKINKLKAELHKLKGEKGEVKAVLPGSLHSQAKAEESKPEKPEGNAPSKSK